MDKRCNKCGIVKDAIEFRSDKRNASGLGSWCKACARIYDCSDKKKLALKKYRQSVSGKRATQKFWRSISGKAAKRRGHLRRRELKHNLDTRLSTSDLNGIFERFSFRCFKCKSTTDLTIDHHCALSAGFGLSVDNAVILCRSCNSRKGSQSPAKFYTKEEYETLEYLLFSVLQ